MGRAYAIEYVGLGMIVGMLLLALAALADSALGGHLTSVAIEQLLRWVD